MFGFGLKQWLQQKHTSVDQKKCQLEEEGKMTLWDIVDFAANITIQPHLVKRLTTMTGAPKTLASPRMGRTDHNHETITFQ